jgi:hypothetical protein
MVPFGYAQRGDKATADTFAVRQRQQHGAKIAQMGADQIEKRRPKRNVDRAFLRIFGIPAREFLETQAACRPVPADPNQIGIQVRRVGEQRAHAEIIALQIIDRLERVSSDLTGCLIVFGMLGRERDVEDRLDLGQCAFRKLTLKQLVDRRFRQVVANQVFAGQPMSIEVMLDCCSDRQALALGLQ